jgi:stress-induced morphogen
VVIAATYRARPARKLHPGAAGYHASVAVTETLEELLRGAFPDAPVLSVVDRTGGGDHFQVVVESGRFSGLTLVEQHRLVYDALAEPLRDGTIHELRIRTRATAPAREPADIGGSTT